MHRRSTKKKTVCSFEMILLTSWLCLWLCSGHCLRGDLLNWMLATACQQGHLDVVRLLVQGYGADAKDCAIHSNEFAVITGLPLYAAARAGKERHRDNCAHLPVHAVSPAADLWYRLKAHTWTLLWMHKDLIIVVVTTAELLWLNSLFYILSWFINIWTKCANPVIGTISTT